MNLAKHSSLIVSIILSHLPFRFGDPLGSGFVFIPEFLTVAVNSFEYLTLQLHKVFL